MSETEIPAEQPVRRGRTPRPQREVHREAPGITVEQRPAAPTRTEVVDAISQMQAKDRENAALRQRAEAAEHARITAEQNARQQQSTDRKAALGEAITAAKAEKEAAAAAYRAAREAGDIDAEIAAQDRMSTAGARFANATAELATLNAAPPAAVPQRPATGQPSPEAQAWMDAHPRLLDDRDYANYALLMDRKATSRGGHKAGSQAYVDYIEREMIAEFGPNHAQEGSRGRPMPAGERENYQDGGDVSAPTNSGGGPRSGARVVRYPIGDMNVRPGRDGGLSVTYRASYGKSEGEVERDYEEAAKTNFPKIWEKDKAQALGMYLQECINASDEGMTDLKIGDGRTWGSGRIDE